MDVLTPAGQKTIEDELRAQEIFESNFSDFKYVHTPKSRPADVDAVVTYEGAVYGVVETKCRYDVDINEFNVKYQASWLVTLDKILKGKAIADALCVPLVGFLYLKKSDVLLMETIYRDGNFIRKIVVENSRTQKTVNGGSIVRTNAFIDMSNAHVLRA